MLTLMTLSTFLGLVMTVMPSVLRTEDTLKEFMMATDMTASGSPEEKLRWAFKMYDKDGSGGLVKKHLVKIRPTFLSVSFGTCLFQ